MTRRWPWALWGLTVLLIVATFRLAALNDSFSEDPFFLSVAIVMIVGYTTLGALIATRTDRNPIGWLLMMIGVGFLLGGFTDEYLRYALPRGPDDHPFTLFARGSRAGSSLSSRSRSPGSSCSSPTGSSPRADGSRSRSRSRSSKVFLLLGSILSPGPIDVDFPGPAPQNPTGVPALEGVLESDLRPRWPHAPGRRSLHGRRAGVPVPTVRRGGAPADALVRRGRRARDPAVDRRDRRVAGASRPTSRRPSTTSCSSPSSSSSRSASRERARSRSSATGSTSSTSS